MIEDRSQWQEAAKKLAAGLKGLDERHDPHMLDVAEMLENVWESVTERTIARCWIKSDILPKCVNGDLINKHGKVSGKKNSGLEIEMDKLMDVFKKLQVSMNDVIMNDVSTNGVVAGDITPTELRRWALLEDDDEIRETMARDVIEEVKQSLASGGNQSEEDGEKRFAGQENAVSIPSPILISSLSEHAEAVSRVAGVGDASMHLRKGKRALLHAYDSQKRTKVRQSIVSDFFK